MTFKGEILRHPGARFVFLKNRMDDLKSKKQLEGFQRRGFDGLLTNAVSGDTATAHDRNDRTREEIDRCCRHLKTGKFTAVERKFALRINLLQPDHMFKLVDLVSKLTIPKGVLSSKEIERLEAGKRIGQVKTDKATSKVA